MINATQSNSRTYMTILLFLGLVLCLQFPGDGFPGKDETLLDTGQNSQPFTRSNAHASELSPDKRIEVVQNAVLTGNTWRGQLRKLHVTTGYSEKVNFEIDVTCTDLVMLHFYTNNKERVFHERFQEMNRPDSSTYNVTFVQRPQPRVEVKNATNDEILLCISLPKIQPHFQLINVQRMMKTIDTNLSPEDGIHSSWRIETMQRPGHQQTQPATQDSGQDKSNKIKLYNNTDGKVIWNTSNAMYNYIHGGYVLPLHDCRSITQLRNKFGLTITLDNDGKAEGEIKISRNKFTDTEETDKYLHLKIKVTEGNSLKMFVLRSDDLGEPLFLNAIHFYGLYGHPDSFVIDKGKRYILEEDLSNSRRITNKIRIYSFTDLRMDVRTSHILSWTYF